MNILSLYKFISFLLYVIALPRVALSYHVRPTPTIPRAHMNSFLQGVKWLKQENTEDDNGIQFSGSSYSGPVLPYDLMEAGCSIQELGIDILIGKSVVAPGYGLYICLNEDVDDVSLPRGTVICGYSRGKFVDSADGDKTVAYCFASPKVGVIYKKKLMPLLDALQDVANLKDDLTKAVAGHLLFYNQTDNDLSIVPDLEYDSGRYFIPDTTFNWGPGYFGMFANDMAYKGSETNMLTYYQASLKENILQIVWRLELTDDGVLGPTWPVVVLSQDVRFSNKEPMECGMQYSWRYWEAFRSNSEGADSLFNES